MREPSVFKNLDMMMLPTTERTLIFKDEFMLTDNLDLPVEAQVEDFAATPGYPVKMNFTLTLFCTAGHMLVKLNLKEYRLEANDVLVILPGSIGECLEFSTDCQVVLLACSDNKYLNDSSSSLAVLFRKYLINQALIHISEEELQDFLTIYRLMRKKMEQTDFEFTREVLLGYMQVLSCNGYQWIIRYYNKKEKEEKAESRQQKLFDSFLELVQKNYKEQRNIGFYAGRLCLTPKYMSRVIYQVSGRYAGDWINDYVILEAKALLKSKKYTVQQVCDMLNFSNPSFFGKYFKAAVGCSPRKYMLAE